MLVGRSNLYVAIPDCFQDLFADAQPDGGYIALHPGLLFFADGSTRLIYSGEPIPMDVPVRYAIDRDTYLETLAEALADVKITLHRIQRQMDFALSMTAPDGYAAMPHD